MESSNSASRSYSAPSCTLQVQTKNTGMPNLPSLDRAKSTGFTLELADLEQDTNGESSSPAERTTVTGSPQQLKKLHDAVSDYVRQLVAEFPLSQSSNRTDDTTPLLGDVDRVLDDASNPSGGSGLSIDNIDRLLSVDRPEEPPTNTTAPLVARLLPERNDTIHLTASDRPLAHDLHVGDLTTNTGKKIVTLSALRLFDLSTVLDAYSSDRQVSVPVETSTEKTEDAPPVAIQLGGTNTESMLSTQLPNLPKLSAQEERFDRDYTTTANYGSSRPAFLSAIPWAAAAAVAVGAPLLLLGPNSNSLKELTGKAKFPKIEMPKVGSKQPSPTVTGSPTATTDATTNPSVYTAKPVPIPNGSTDPTVAKTNPNTPNPTVSPAATEAGITVGALPAGMGEKSSIDLDTQDRTAASQTPTPAPVAGSTQPQPYPTTTTVAPGGDITTTAGAVAPTGAATPLPTVKPTQSAKPPAAKVAKTPIAKTPVGKSPSVIPNIPTGNTTSTIPGLTTEMPSVTNIPSISVPNTQVPPATAKPAPTAKKPAPKPSPVAKKPAPKPAPIAKKPAPKPSNVMPAIDSAPVAQQPIAVPDIMPVQQNPNLIPDGFPPNGVPGGIDPQPNPQVAAGTSDPFDTPAVRDAKRFFQGKWKANAKQSNSLQYVVRVGAKTGVVKTVTPQGAESQSYLKQSGIVKPGQKIISPAAAGASDRQLRAILNPDGSVEVIPE
jgi:hypothetical protein